MNLFEKMRLEKEQKALEEANAKKNPFGVIEDIPNDKEKAKEEVKEEVKEDIKEDIKEEVKEDIKEEIKEEVKEDIKEKETVKPIIKKDKDESTEKEALTEEIKDTKKEIVKESEKKTKPKTTKKTKVVQEEPFVMPTTQVGLNEAINAITSSFYDQQWEDYKKDIDTQLGELLIEDDMNPSDLKRIVSELSKIRQELWLPFQETKTLLEQLSSREPEGLIEMVKRITFSNQDKNDMERKKAGILACLSYIPPNSETPLNLYEMLHEIRARYNFLKAAMDSIQYKTNVLITMNGALKLEQTHMPGEV